MCLLALMYSSGGCEPVVGEAYYMRSCLFGRCCLLQNSVLRHLGSADEYGTEMQLLKLPNKTKIISKFRYDEPAGGTQRFTVPTEAKSAPKIQTITIHSN